MRYLVLCILVAATAPASAQSADKSGTVESVTVTAQKLPLDQAVHDFIQTYAKPSPVTGKFARWGKGAPICPQAIGLSPDANIVISDRIRAVSGSVGAPVQTQLPCKPNMVVVFTSKPQAVLDAIRTTRKDLLGFHYLGQEADLTRVKYPIQAWYGTATRDNNGVTRADDSETDTNVAAFIKCTSVGMSGCGSNTRGSLVKDGFKSEIITVTVVVDSSKIIGMQLGAVADYVAMLGLSQTDAFQTCQPIASITNLMSANCDGQKAQGLTDGDMAYLKGLYKIDADLLPQFEKGAVARQIESALEGH